MGLFPVAVLRIAEAHLNMRPAVPAEWTVDVDEKPLLHDMLSGGLMGNNDINRMHSINITLGAVSSRGSSHHRLSGLSNALFPSPDYIRNEYGYVDRCPLLLPVGWLHHV